MKNILKHLVIDGQATIGSKVLLLSVRPYASYKEGVKGEQEGVTFNCLSEKMGFEKVDIKVAGILEPPFEFDGSPIPVEFDGLEVKIWQDWKNKDEVKLSVTAKNVRLAENKRIKLGSEKV